MMGANHGAIDHLQGVRDDPALGQRLQDLFPETGERPATELPIDARPFSELSGQSRTVRLYGDPEIPSENKTVVGWFAPVRGADSQDERFKERPLRVRHQVSCQAGLHRRYQLESRLSTCVNPFCQHVLEKI